MSETLSTLISAAQPEGNGAFYLIELDQDSSALSTTRIGSDDFDGFDGFGNAKFGTAVVDVGDRNNDGQNDYQTGSPGIQPAGAVF